MRAVADVAQSPSAYSITMRVPLGADPLGIGRITTAVGEAAGTVVTVDISGFLPDLPLSQPVPAASPANLRQHPRSDDDDDA